VQLAGQAAGGADDDASAAAALDGAEDLSVGRQGAIIGGRGRLDDGVPAGDAVAGRRRPGGGRLPALQALGQLRDHAPASPTTLTASCLWASWAVTLTWTSFRSAAPNRAREPVVKSCSRVPMPDDQVGVLSRRIGRRTAGDTDDCPGCAMIPGQGALTALGLGDRQVGAQGQAASAVRRGCRAPSSGHDQRPAGRLEQGNEGAQVAGIRLWPADAPDAAIEEALWIVEGLRLDILTEGQGGGPQVAGSSIVARARAGRRGSVRA